LIVGNDIVDLGDAETRIEKLHPRFIGRVFSAAERQRIFSSRDTRMLLWAHWAAKESAYKALKKLDPGTVFSHSAFVVDLGGHAGHTWSHGHVLHAGRRIELAVEYRDDWVHAVANLAASDRTQALQLEGVSILPAGADPSAQVRAFALAQIAGRLGCGAGLEIAGSRPPRLLHHGARLQADISLSHHGRRVAFAAAVRPE